MSVKPYFEKNGIRVSKIPFDDLGKRWIYASHQTFIGALILKFRGYKNFETPMIYNGGGFFRPLWKKELQNADK